MQIIGRFLADFDDDSWNLMHLQLNPEDGPMATMDRIRILDWNLSLTLYFIRISTTSNAKDRNVTLIMNSKQNS